MASPQTLPVVAIAGATGHLGKHVASAFLTSNLRNRFSEIILLSRQGSSSNHHQPPAGIPDDTHSNSPKLTIRNYTEDDETSITHALHGAHILINTVGPSGHSFKEKLLHAVSKTDIQLYFPSEFGVNHYVHDFPHLEWDAKKKHMALANELLFPKKVKICRVFCGLFLEDSIGPWFGFDTKRGRYESVGSSEVLVSFTSLEDVGKSVAALASLPVAEVPEVVHLAGDSRSVREIAEIMGAVAGGGGEIEVVEVGLEGFKKETTAQESWDPAAYLRFLMGEGKILHTRDGLGNDDELVNPGQRVWKWETLRDLAEKTGGRPWGDYAWPPQ
ncbi:hypothetical protein AbraIFM66950_004073 [Aspergillus brasiliensis]|nr:hypothetical protein AbraIFM66950_004073 [Aspergillus brasiliensis]